MNTFYLILLGSFLGLATKSYSQTKAEHKIYVESIIQEIEKVKSAKYSIHYDFWMPWDTLNRLKQSLWINEYTNEQDTAIGSSFVSLNFEHPDTTEFIYDGNMRVLIYHEVRGMVIDSFKLNLPNRPSRPLNPPFFNYTKSILSYILESQDSISTVLTLEDTSHVIELTIHEPHQIEFFGKPFRVINPYQTDDPTSKYIVWINPETKLPYQYSRIMSHNAGISTIKDLEINTLSLGDFKAVDYFPKGYEIRPYSFGRRSQNESEWIGQIAPSWILEDSENHEHRLENVKSKLILLQFTGIGCGPCVASIPFLNQLDSTFDRADLEVISVEFWQKKRSSLKAYIEKYDIDYKSLVANEDVIKQYKLSSAPVFFLLNEKREIVKVYRGYSRNTSDKEIMEAIISLL